jgi:hypothetical protein
MFEEAEQQIAQSDAEEYAEMRRTIAQLTQERDALAQAMRDIEMTVYKWGWGWDGDCGISDEVAKMTSEALANIDKGESK